MITRWFFHVLPEKSRNGKGSSGEVDRKSGTKSKEFNQKIGSVCLSLLQQEKLRFFLKMACQNGEFPKVWWINLRVSHFKGRVEEYEGQLPKDGKPSPEDVRIEIFWRFEMRWSEELLSLLLALHVESADAEKMANQIDSGDWR